MFTGLVEEVGRVGAIASSEDRARLEIVATDVADGLRVGDSVAVNGVCLTAVEIGRDGFAVDCVAETLRRSALGGLEPGAAVNLERALRADARLGGHIVQGHVDGVGTLRRERPEGDGVLREYDAPAELLRYVVEKGSIAVDGVSLTVAGRDPEGFSVALIPHTLSATTLGRATPGQPSNLEVDVLAKYVEALVRPYEPDIRR